MSQIVQRAWTTPGRLVPPGSRHLRSRAIVLPPGRAVDWHSTGRREELLIGVGGWVRVEFRDRRRRAASRRLSKGRTLFIPQGREHRVINTSRAAAHYLYVTGR